ncbi:MAG: hypothetical protein M1838_003186 [Thelocarpon superellum]|nr:MAG: hypothetical protein M1838_003186 [Thelocarpon superellum]
MATRFFTFALLLSLISYVAGLSLTGQINTREEEAFLITIVNPGPETINLTSYYNLFDNVYADKNVPLLFQNQSSGAFIGAPYISYPPAPSSCDNSNLTYLTLRPAEPFKREIVFQEIVNPTYSHYGDETAVTVYLPSFATGYFTQDGANVGPEQAFGITFQPFNTTVTLSVS